jgi:hypothetical protein
MEIAGFLILDSRLSHLAADYSRPVFEHSASAQGFI